MLIPAIDVLVIIASTTLPFIPLEYGGDEVSLTPDGWSIGGPVKVVRLLSSVNLTTVSPKPLPYVILKNSASVIVKV